jgi:hypothetical protein
MSATPEQWAKRRAEFLARLQARSRAAWTKGRAEAVRALNAVRPPLNWRKPTAPAAPVAPTVKREGPRNGPK